MTHTPSWAFDAIWWHCYPLGFVGAPLQAQDSKSEHRLTRLQPWLDYLIELGANGLLLGPIFTSASHGYDTLDHLAIDPRLGDDADFDTLIAACRQRGIRVVLDGVFNHVARDHEIVRRALRPEASAEERAWLTWSGEHPYCFEGHFDLVELNLQHPPVQAYVIDVMTHWLDRGIDGWRLDAAYAPGAAAWRPITEAVKAAYPECWLLGEVIHGDYPAFVTESGVDSVTQYELWKAIWSSLNDVNFHELAHALGRHNEFCETFRPQTFLGNHDVTRIASKLDDARQLPLAIALLMTLPGVPSIYAGDEQGFVGVKRDEPGGDDAVRPEFPDDPTDLSPLGGDILSTWQELIGLRRRHAWLGDAAITVDEVSNDAIAIRLNRRESNEPGALVLRLRAAGDVGWSLTES